MNRLGLSVLTSSKKVHLSQAQLVAPPQSAVECGVEGTTILTSLRKIPQTTHSSSWWMWCQDVIIQYFHEYRSDSSAMSLFGSFARIIATNIPPYTWHQVSILFLLGGTHAALKKRRTYNVRYQNCSIVTEWSILRSSQIKIWFLMARVWGWKSKACAH